MKTGADGWYAGGTGVSLERYVRLATPEPRRAHGGVKQLLLGNGLVDWEQRRYNVRLQPTQIGLGDQPRPRAA